MNYGSGWINLTFCILISDNWVSMIMTHNIELCGQEKAGYTQQMGELLSKHCSEICNHSK